MNVEIHPRSFVAGVVLGLIILGTAGAIYLK